ncbi:MAG: UDP-4-amino-4,6-dideoxy-N-acetyl-beta-L-altrosamine transaminase [Xanthomonadales bacterium]|nr:UDP-4-amino-4,6-dideoxy-N-acetyl-beta-L-altrosamine transaminase [Xanthomonadales bacterium]
MIPYGRQEISQEDIDAVVSVLVSDYLTQGPAVPRFEQAVASHVGVQYALAVNSATSALHLACRALDLGPGDWLWTSPITFVASANCALYCGAQVDFVDIDDRSYNLCPDKLAAKLEQAEREGCLPKIVVPVHMCGQSCDMQAIHELSQRYGFRIIEDASHAIGGKYQDDFVGACRFSDIAIFSFHPVKIITTAEGGMALTNDRKLADQMALLRSHGITRDPEQMTHEPDGPWYYEQVALGYNYRLTDIQAALGHSQLQRLDGWVLRRHEIKAFYDQALAGLPLTIPWQHPDTWSALHLYPVRLQLERISLSHRQVFEELRAQGVGVNVHYIPVHLQPYYRSMGFLPGDFPLAERYYAQAITLPIYPGLSEQHLQRVVSVLTGVLGP